MTSENNDLVKYNDIIWDREYCKTSQDSCFTFIWLLSEVGEQQLCTYTLRMTKHSIHTVSSRIVVSEQHIFHCNNHIKIQKECNDQWNQFIEWYQSDDYTVRQSWSTGRNISQACWRALRAPTMDSRLCNFLLDHWELPDWAARVGSKATLKPDSIVPDMISKEIEISLYRASMILYCVKWF